MAQLVKYAFDVTFAVNATLSNQLDLGEGRAAVLQMPGTWDAADLTLLVSVDGTNYFSLYKGADDSEYKIEAAASRSLLLPLNDFLGIRFLQFRSGTSGAPVAQTGARTLVLGVVG